MERIYHEKQDGFFCAQHCLNNLLQGPYFSPIELSDIAHNLDARERNTLDQTTALTGCFNNDETGFFSIQVIIVALQNLGLEAVPYGRHSPEAEAARQNPTQQMAFICNFQEHWLSIRRLGRQWFDLNSTHSAPKLISNTFLSLFLTQLTQDGFSIWCIMGTFPDCEVHQYLLANPVPEVYANSISDRNRPAIPHGASSDGIDTGNAEGAAFNDGDDDNDESLQRVLAMTREEADIKDTSLQHLLAKTGQDAEDDDLKLALLLSVQDSSLMQTERYLSIEETDDDLNAAIALSLRQSEMGEEEESTPEDANQRQTEGHLPLEYTDFNLNAATELNLRQTELSAEESSASEIADTEFIRKKRAAYFENRLK